MWIAGTLQVLIISIAKKEKERTRQEIKEGNRLLCLSPLESGLHRMSRPVPNCRNVPGIADGHSQAETVKLDVFRV